MINNYADYVHENTSLFPVLAAYLLNRRDVIYDAETVASLNKFAKEKGHHSFDDLVVHLNTMSPEEICNTYT